MRNRFESWFRNKPLTHIPMENELGMPSMTDEAKVYNPWADNALTPGVKYAKLKNMMKVRCGRMVLRVPGEVLVLFH